MIIVNGMAKSGSHAVMAWLTQLGMKRTPGTILPAPDGQLRVVGRDLTSVRQDTRPYTFILAHVPADHGLWGSVITVFRDPRNMLLSYCRHRERVDCYRPSLTEAIDDYWGQPFVELYDRYLGWRGRSVVVHYENLPPAQVGDGRAIYVGHSHDWNTRTGSPSDWRNEWDEHVEDVWQARGGPDLLKRAGYGEHNDLSRLHNPPAVRRDGGGDHRPDLRIELPCAVVRQAALNGRSGAR